MSVNHLEKLKFMKKVYESPNTSTFEKQLVLATWASDGSMDELIKWMENQAELLRETIGYMGGKK